jgi:arginase family enzyme
LRRLAPAIQVTFDAADPHALAAWWAERLGYEVEDGHDLASSLLEGGIVAESDVVRVEDRMWPESWAAAAVPRPTTGWFSAGRTGPAS